MSLSLCIALVLIGIAIGLISGAVGIGGGVLVIPVLVFAFGMTQAKANGTSLAMMIPPVGLFAVLTYSRAGNIDWRYAMLLASGFVVGAYFGAKAINTGLISPTALRVIFALLLVYVASRMLFRPGGRARSALEVAVMFLVFGGTYAVMRLLGRRLERSPGPWGQTYRSRRAQPLEHDYEI